MSRTRKLWVHRRGIWITSPARKQKCAFDSRGHIKRKLDIKGCFKKSFGCQETGAEGIQSKNERLGRPEVLSCGSDSWGSQGQNSQWEAGLFFCSFKGGMFIGHSRKRQETLDFTACVTFCSPLIGTPELVKSVGLRRGFSYGDPKSGCLHPADNC